MKSNAYKKGHMRVARYYNNSSVSLEVMERPTIEDGELLVRVMACGICGSDTMEWFRVPKSPRILGHEISGVVEESRSDAYPVGERIVVRNQVPCGTCYVCEHQHHSVCEEMEEIEPGGMSEYVRVPRRVVEHGLSRLPSKLSFPEATLAEPIACVLHSQSLARIKAHHCVVVLGCGAFGILHVQAAKHLGVERVIAVDNIEFRRDSARRFGAVSALSPDEELSSEVKSQNEGRLADVVIIATGSPSAIEAACDALGRHGTILLFGATAPDNPSPLSLNQLFWRKELTMVSSYGAGNVPFSRALQLIESGDFRADELITDCVPFASVQQGFDIVANPGDSLKVVLEIAAEE